MGCPYVDMKPYDWLLVYIISTLCTMIWMSDYACIGIFNIYVTSSFKHNRKSYTVQCLCFCMFGCLQQLLSTLLFIASFYQVCVQSSYSHSYYSFFFFTIFSIISMYYWLMTFYSICFFLCMHVIFHSIVSYVIVSFCNVDFILSLHIRHQYWLLKHTLWTLEVGPMFLFMVF